MNEDLHALPNDVCVQVKAGATVAMGRSFLASWHSPQSIYNVGHNAVAEMLKQPVYLTEKVDGSFFAFGKFNGEMRYRSKGKEIYSPDGMFAPAVKTADELMPHLTDGWTYRGELVGKPKHNTLRYNRVPEGYVILFDICTDEETYLPYDELAAEAYRIGLEVVPRLYEGVLSLGVVEELLKTESILGGTTIEGVVAKQVNDTPLYGSDKKILMAKYVAPSFREANSLAWKVSNPGKGDLVAMLKEKYRTEARWKKSIQHLREQGQLENSPRDIGLLIKEIQTDITKDAADEVREALFRWAWPDILRGSTAGFPEFYKQYLLESAFEMMEAGGAEAANGRLR